MFVQASFKKSSPKTAFFAGGDIWNRTKDLMHVKHAL